ncbi:hypothetical protein C8R42DRAFT_723387 [Lentinula raphanica]|nr:hypothetical protein C8R42DRAFT_723387 [Lentinula raphanica]
MTGKRRSARLDKSTAPEGSAPKKRRENDTIDTSKPTRPTRTKDVGSSNPHASSKGTTAKFRSLPKSTPQPLSAEFMGNLDVLAPPMEDSTISTSKVVAASKRKAIVLNDEETNADLGDDEVLELLDSEDEKKDVKQYGQQSESEADYDYDEEDDILMDEGLEDNSPVAVGASRSSAISLQDYFAK